MAYTTINKSTDYFNTVLHTGANKTVSVGFEPSFSWVKERDAAGHALFDAVRGATKLLESNSSNTQATLSDSLTSFTSDGFVLGADSGGYVGGSSQATVSWNWRGNGAGSSNTDGSITSTVSANTTAGFSIVKWTGNSSNATIGHGLGVKPSMIIIKSLANTTFWMTYHSSLGNNSEIYLNRADYGASASSTAWQDTDPTSSVFYVGGSGGDGVNVSGDYVAYCFAEKIGYSKINSYVGNGGNNNEAPFIYTGFKPVWFLVKKSSAAGEDWAIYDNARNPFNKVDEALFPSESSAETNVGNGIDFLSNGIKINDDGGELNTSGATYIYYAIGQSIVGSNNVPATAR